VTDASLQSGVPVTARASGRKNPPRLDRFIILLALAGIVMVWGIVIAFTLTERQTALERAQSQLQSTVSTLADFNQLALLLSDQSGAASSDRAAAIWRALLQYPAASIWVETHGVVTAGQPPEDNSGPAVSAVENRGDFAVHAIVPEHEALTDWRQSAWWRAAALLLAGIAFLAITEFLARALRRAAAAESVLREHDALLNSVTKSAADLLGSHSLGEAVGAVLELTGRTLGVGQVQLKSVTADADGVLRSSIKYEWCEPGKLRLIDNPLLQNLDIKAHFPTLIAPMLTGDLATFSVDELDNPLKALFENAGLRSFLEIPVLVEGKLWGSLVYIDSSAVKRIWSWAETDTSKTLAELIGIAVARAGYVKDLADANTIVQNSPTILFRLRGEPSLPLIYISRNVAKFGCDPAKLLAAPLSYLKAIDPGDKQAVTAELARVVQKDAPGASLEFRIVSDDGVQRWIEARYTPVRDTDGRLIEIEGIVVDVTERKAAEDKIKLLARTDPLTGLANRATFVERLHQVFASTQRGGGPFGLLYLDLDHFKDINDTLGHPVGDQLLKAVAQRLTQCVRETDLVARLGGDEFAILQADMGEPAAAAALAAKILTALSATYKIDGNELHVTVSVGISPYVSATDGPDAMLSQADLALYRSKEEGRNCYRFHSDELDQQVDERVTLAEDLRKAIEQNQLELYYQPQVEIASGRIVGMEALIRWNHPERGQLSPAVFLPIAEKTGCMVAVGHWVLDHACQQMRLWRDQGVAPPAIAINLSLIQLKAGRDLVNDIAETTKKWGITEADLEFDVTEATLAQSTFSQNDVLAKLRQGGAKIAIDDFGAEYSSFDYIRTYAIDHLKIAQHFIDLAGKDSKRASTIRAIMLLARELGIEVVAKGVETEAERAMVLSAGSETRAQGFLFSKPVGSDQALELLKDGFIHPTKT
jgi:diguanylate cyclase (GGDEF)-like protein/PAS domain S-box-containing protein